MKSIINRSEAIDRIWNILICIVIWVLLSFLGNNTFPGFQIIIWIFPYTALLQLLLIFAKLRFIRILYSILWIPGYVVLFLGPYVQSISALIYSYVIIVGGNIALFMFLPVKVFEYSITMPASVYLVLTSSAIIATSLSNKLIKSWHFAQARDYKEFSENLSLKMMDQSKARFVIFTIYFVLLIAFTFTSLNKVPLLNDSNYEKAILQSLATYIAFDRIVSNWRSFKKSKI